ncbi:hypothetical protein MLD38_002612 [Melastoma candidum]|uniref:Uncharacterized protein n=1 Tax=Melastoma candidum TaxID=119954 RepID=A0ACB9S8G4_9MYRT|nr:hypothetical protein MLD38_002612 [Melastoma candidum]
MIMGESPASYIHLVHHLIEKCLIYRMTKEECMEALSKDAKIEPVVTSTVWNELEKENKEFFEAYAAQSSQGGSGCGGSYGDGGGGKEDRMTEEETSKMIHKMISDDKPDHSKPSGEINPSRN